jgi:CRP/FNR family transcriptional regulator
MIEKNSLIRNLTFFKSLNDEQLEKISQISQLTTHPAKSILFYEDETYNKLYFLVSGLLKVYKIDKYNNEIFLYHIYKDSFISELKTLESPTIHCFSNAEFLEDSIVLEIDYLGFKNQFLSQNILTNEFINEILLKTYQLHCVVNRELVFDATAKVAYMLNHDLVMFNNLKRQEVSFMLHIQPETLSRVLKKLKRSNIIDSDDAKIVILDSKMLTKIYQGDSL